ncbi:MAG: DUF3830 family protein [Proteobacteria bacterium]|nr:DUF3830 family protein [Pseudomonadota bacterium]
MAQVTVTSGAYRFASRLEEALAPRTCALFKSWLPYRQKLIHVRWSGEGCWIPLGHGDTALPYENATSYPAPGQFIFHPGGVSEAEILVAYGPVRFASKAGQLAGNPFLTITEGLDRLADLGRLTLQAGAQDILFELT